jgi:hypothetical protein
MGGSCPLESCGHGFVPDIHRLRLTESTQYPGAYTASWFSQENVGFLRAKLEDEILRGILTDVRCCSDVVMFCKSPPVNGVMHAHHSSIRSFGPSPGSCLFGTFRVVISMLQENSQNLPPDTKKVLAARLEEVDALADK